MKLGIRATSFLLEQVVELILVLTVRLQYNPNRTIRTIPPGHQVRPDSIRDGYYLSTRPP